MILSCWVTCKMSNGEVRKVSLQDIQLVQNLIERCLQLYMSQREVVSTLLHQARIEPSFTELVWQKLEAENEEFFRAYHLRLMVKDQILRFNQLLERQIELTRQISQTGVFSIPLTNGSQIHSMRSNSAYNAVLPAGPSIKQENTHQSISAIPNIVYTSGASSMQVAVNMAGHAGTRINTPPNMLLAQSSNAGIMGETIIKTESDYGAGDSTIMFHAENSLLEPRNAIGEVSFSSFNGGESSSQPLNETVLHPEMNSFGLLGQISRSFSLSDLTTDFSNSTDISEGYSRSPHLGTDANFLDPHFSGEQQARIRRLDIGFSYCDNFGSD